MANLGEGGTGEEEGGSNGAPRCGCGARRPLRMAGIHRRWRSATSANRAAGTSRSTGSTEGRHGSRPGLAYSALTSSGSCSSPASTASSLYDRLPTGTPSAGRTGRTNRPHPAAAHRRPPVPIAASPHTVHRRSPVVPLKVGAGGGVPPLNRTDRTRRSGPPTSSISSPGQHRPPQNAPTPPNAESLQDPLDTLDQTIVPHPKRHIRRRVRAWAAQDRALGRYPHQPSPRSSCGATRVRPSRAPRRAALDRAPPHVLAGSTSHRRRRPQPHSRCFVPSPGVLIPERPAHHVPGASPGAPPHPPPSSGPPSCGSGDPSRYTPVAPTLRHYLHRATARRPKRGAPRTPEPPPSPFPPAAASRTASPPSATATTGSSGSPSSAP